VASEIIDRLILRGAKWGIGVGIATQRPANLAITARTQAGIAILHRVEQARDVSAYADLLPADWTEARITQTMHSLDRGQALVKVPGWGVAQVQVVSIRERMTPHMGYTPTFDGPAPPEPGRLRLPAALLIELRAVLRPVEPLTPAPMPEETTPPAAAVEPEPDEVMLEHMLSSIAFEPDVAGRAVLAEAPAAVKTTSAVATAPPNLSLGAAERRLLTLAAIELDGRWPIKQLWQHVRGERIVSWDELVGKVTPELAAAGYLTKDHLGRWTLTARARAAAAEIAA
jgi:hypothetical protein